MWLLFKGASRDLPTPSPAQSTQGDGEEVGGPKPKRKGHPSWGTPAPCSQSCQATSLPELPETSLHLTFPSQSRPASCSEQKVRGQEREAMCLFPSLHGAGKATWSGVWGVLGAAPCCHSPAGAISDPLRMMSFPEACFQPVLCALLLQSSAAHPDVGPWSHPRAPDTRPHSARAPWQMSSSSAGGVSHDPHPTWGGRGRMVPHSASGQTEPQRSWAAD